MKKNLTIIPLTIGLGINAQVEKLNDLSDVLFEDTSLYVGHTPTTTNGANSNIALGKTALSLITTGDYNTAIGHNTLFSNTIGEKNTALGYESLYTNTSGAMNTASGYQALFSNTTGSENTASGVQVLHMNTSGAMNTASGYQALYNNTEGNFNSASGSGALKANTLGHNNTAFGNLALDTIVGSSTTSEYTDGKGYGNTALGYNANASSAYAINQTIIGYKANGQADNSVVLGNSEVTTVYMGDGDSYAKVYAGEGNFSGQLTIGGNMFIASDIRLKANIVSLGATLSKLLLIDGKTYTMKKEGKQKIGVLAQDIRKVFPELVSEGDHEMLAVNYQGLVPVIINALKEQNSKLTEENNKMTAQNAKILRLEQLVEKLIAHK